MGNSHSNKYRLDFSMFNYKLSGSVDYFDRTTEDLLISVPVQPPVLPVCRFKLRYFNQQRMEATVSYKDKIGDFGYNVSGNFTFVKNQFTNLKE
jgi:iron complex outermembrane receptor protein